VIRVPFETTDPDILRELVDSALPIAGLFITLLGVALFLLWRSMRRQLGRIDPALPGGADDELQAEDRRLTEEAVERGAATDPDDDSGR
jgi:hypothetical protein